MNNLEVLTRIHANYIGIGKSEIDDIQADFRQLRKALSAPDEINNGLMETIESQKEIFDAVIKKLVRYVDGLDEVSADLKQGLEIDDKAYFEKHIRSALFKVNKLKEMMVTLKQPSEKLKKCLES